MSEAQPKPKRTYFRPTTPQQRRLLFETYEQTHDIATACRVAHVAERTFYYWRPRFQAGGYAALAHERSRAPHTTRIPPTPETTVQEVIAYRRAHPTAGYGTVANELQKAHHWERVISPTQVRRILLKAGLVAPPASPPAAAGPPRAVHAPAPEQTANVDLCFVPVSHAPGAALDVVSGSDDAFSPSGRAAAGRT